MTLEEFTKIRNKYVLNSMPGLSESTKEIHRRSIDEWEDFMFLGDHGLKPDLEDSDLYALFLNHVWAKFKREGPRRVSSSVVRFLRWCLRAGIIQRDPSLVVRQLKTVQSPTKPALTRSDFDAILANCIDGRLRWLFIAGWYTGLAMVDICELSVDEVDIKNWCITKRRRKSDTNCIIPIETGSMFHVELLERMKAVDPSHRVNDQNAEKFYLNPDLLEWYRSSHGNLTTAAKALMLKAGVDKHKTFHSLRVAYCSMLANGGVNMGLACKMTGHKNPETVVRRYLKVKPVALHQALHDARAKQAEHEDAAFLD